MAVDFATEEEREADSSNLSSVQLFGSKLQAILAEEEEEEKEKGEEEGGEEEEQEEVALGGNLVATNPILVLSSDDEALEVIVLSLILEVQREEVEHSFQW